MTKSIENLNWRYATKKFDSTQKLDRKQLEMLAAAFNLTATSYGLQPCRLIIVEDPVVKEKMLPIAYGQRQVVDAHAVLVLCTLRVDKSYVEDYFNLVMSIRDTSEETLAPFKKQLIATVQSMDETAMSAWAKNQAYIILGNLMAVCAQEKIDSCPMEGFIPEKIDALLDLENKGLSSVLLLPVGYRAADDMFATMQKVRLPITDSVHFI